MPKEPDQGSSLLHPLSPYEGPRADLLRARERYVQAIRTAQENLREAHALLAKMEAELKAFDEGRAPPPPRKASDG